MRRIFFVSSIVVSLLLMQGCTKQPVSVNQGSAPKGVAKIQLVAAQGSAFARLARSATAFVEGAGMDTIRQPLSVKENSVSGTISNIPAGLHRMFRVFVYDSTGQVCYYGTATADIIANGTVALPMTLYRWNMGNAIINGQIIDSIPTPECYVIDTLCYSNYYGQYNCFIRKICNGDTVIDSMGNIECHVIDSTCFFDRHLAQNVCLVRKVCNGDTVVDTIIKDDNNQLVRITIPLKDTNTQYHFYRGDTISISAILPESISVDRVLFYCDTFLLGTSTSKPFTVTPVLAMSSGPYYVYAIAYDRYNNSYISNRIGIYIQFNAPPDVIITSPANNSTFRKNQTITVSVRASDRDGYIIRVQLLCDSMTVIGSDTLSPATFRISGLNSGSHRLMAQAWDNYGVVRSSPIVGIIVR
jgi:hypothetical protein